MNKIYSRIAISLAFIAIMVFSYTSLFANEGMNTLQVSTYVGPVLNLSASDVGGMHSALGPNAPLVGKSIDADLMYASVQGMEMNQSILWGVNGRYYFASYGIDIGIDADLSVSSIKSPAQTVTVKGMKEGTTELANAGIPQAAVLDLTRPDPLPQPESDFDMLSLSIGPIFRYKDSGFFDRLNPYISPSVSFHYGRANGVNYGVYNKTINLPGGATYIYPDPDYYGKFDSSDIKGIGYGAKIGFEYFISDNLGFLMEFRYTQIHIEIDKFRSYTRGLDVKTHTTSLLFGTTWRF